MGNQAGGGGLRTARIVGMLAGGCWVCIASTLHVNAAPIEISTNVVGLRDDAAVLEFSLINLDDGVDSVVRIDNIRFEDANHVALVDDPIDFEGIAQLSDVAAVDVSLTPTLVSLVPGSLDGVGVQLVELIEDPLVGATVLRVVFDAVPVAATWLTFDASLEPGAPFSGNGLGADTLTASLFDMGGVAVNKIDPEDDFSAALLSVEGDLPPEVNGAFTQTIPIPEPTSALGMLWLLGISVVRRRARRGPCILR